mmetsp:Transcript_56540/g.106038  ORF Transcript_56540/g.106038 Transcript_56540/m.106038 type:complete len:202 (+) Transcript_56540:1672-2277(+)
MQDVLPKRVVFLDHRVLNDLLALSNAHGDFLYLLQSHLVFLSTGDSLVTLPRYFAQGFFKRIRSRLRGSHRASMLFHLAENFGQLLRKAFYLGTQLGETSLPFLITLVPIKLLLDFCDGSVQICFHALVQGFCIRLLPVNIFPQLLSFASALFDVAGQLLVSLLQLIEALILLAEFIGNFLQLGLDRRLDGIINARHEISL